MNRVPAILALGMLSASAFAAVDACFIPIDCPAVPQLFSPSNLIVKCQIGSWPTDNPLVQKSRVSVCTVKRKKAGEASATGNILLRDGSLEALGCGDLTSYNSNNAFRIQDLPPSTTTATATVTIPGPGGSSIVITVPVEIGKYCTIYQPNPASVPSDDGGCGGPAASRFIKCREP